MKKTKSWLAMLAAVLAAGLVTAAEPAAAQADWPLWDGKESVADYAKRAGIKEVEMSLDLGGGVAMKLTLIPAGKFIMGCLDERREIVEGVDVVVQEGGGADWCMPDREVTLSKPFYMGIYEVTQEQYAQIMGDNWDSRYKMGWQSQINNSFASPEGFPKGKTHPESLLLWEEAAEFCEKVSAKTGRKVWLPTEAQWQYACKAGSKPTDKWYGGPKDNADFHKCENFTIVAGRKNIRTAPAGSFKPNPWGLYDMLGNVVEWVHDWYWRYYDDAPTLDPTGPGISPPGHWHTGLMHVYVGGGWGDPSSVSRPFEWEGCKFRGPGFRVVVAVESAGEKTQAGNPLKASVVAAAAKTPPKALATGPVDPKLRVPAGCRAAGGAKEEPYTKSGWAQAIVHEATGMELVYIPAGKFLMGTPPDTTPLQPQSLLKRRALEEKPHRVTLTKGFYMGKYEVTQALWEKVMGHNPSLFKNAGPEAPVDTVFWAQCQDFCKKAGGGLRLPSEAEWEYACRAGTEGPFAGNLDEMGWHLGNSDRSTHPVGLKKPNAWGLYDMHGNVREWCQDGFKDWYPDGEVTDPVGAKEGWRIIRGGSWADYVCWCRSAARGIIDGRDFGDPNRWQDAAKAARFLRGFNEESDHRENGSNRPDFGCRFVITAAGAP